MPTGKKTIINTVETPFSTKEIPINIPIQVFDIQGYKIYIFKKITLQIFIVFSIFIFIIIAFRSIYKNMKQHAIFAIEKDHIISNISHELKTRVATTKVIIESLVNYNGLEDKNKTIKYLNVAHWEMERLEKMIDRAMAIMTSDSGQLQLKLKKLSITDLVEEIINKMQPLLNEKGANQRCFRWFRSRCNRLSEKNI